MAIFQYRGGEILPGFDCDTGQAVGYTAAEWRYRTHNMILKSNDYLNTTHAYSDDKLRYEIYATIGEF